ncbi:hypothetical protein FHT44_005016 [Mycolicibacterium sp. BK634]|uniref:hypothetical protein n=1 Tax=Mycolicibacterium sp. BK634 TaxID=2587099 RepID=UPI001609D14D|nr:hypothetical protein [Mycolicibacterium sp. BK634]MBB3752504.1 hypothetical protein [Mycolicibacterium sp. BK634]
MTHQPGCNCGLPPDAVVTAVLTVVEYIDANGQLWKADFSEDGSGEELEFGKTVELCEWVKMVHQLPVLVDMIHDYVYGDEGEEDDEGDYATV